MESGIKLYFCALMVIVLASCEKFVNIPPPNTQLVGASVYSENSTAVAAVIGIYSTMINSSIGGGQSGISALLGLSAEEFVLYPTTSTLLNETYTNSLLSTSTVPFWSQLYNCIYQANLAIEGIKNSSGLSQNTKRQLLGEANFIRAFCNFYLINIYGDAPLVNSTDYHVNSLVARSTVEAVYEQIIVDLRDAKLLLDDSYLNPDGTASSQRVRPNKATAAALLARVFLYKKEWSNAEVEATFIIGNPIYQLTTNFNTVFLATGNKEAIWQLEPINNGFNTADGTFLLGYMGTGVPRSAAPFLLSDSLVNQFETNDLRKVNWTVSKTVGSKKYFFPYKYKLRFTGQPPTEYPVLFRLAEQYLIRAEARSQLGNLLGAKEDLNIIRTRAGLGNISPSSQSDLLAAILRERRFELFTEYGHRWFDLTRSENIDNVMSIVTPQKGGTWESMDKLYPIPAGEIEKNPNLIQNPGYQ
jgi:starch-binding outer membrane protein, SusD/RagB family